MEREPTSVGDPEVPPERAGAADMNGDRAVAAVVAVLCVVAFGTAATTLESSLSSEPGDLVDPEYGGLPFEQEDVEEIREALKTKEDEGDGGQSTKPSEDSQEEPQPASSGGDGEGQSAPESGSDGPESAGQGPAEPSPLDRLLAFLLSLWPLLVILVVGVLAYRYRDRLRALLVGLLGGIAPTASEGRSAEPDPWAGFDPSNDVERAWVTMVRAAGLSRPWTKTPGECADEAVSSGMDPEAVRTITDAYEEVRYGGAQPTDRQERRARNGLSELGVGGSVV